MKKRYLSLSYLRILSTIAVIYLHICSTLADNRELFTITDQEYRFFRTGEGLVEWAVPVFLMISGALLLRKDKVISPKDVILKYCRRMVLVLLVFGIPFGMMVQWFETREWSFALTTNAILRVLRGDTLSHMWYVYLLIGIYLILPILKAAVDHGSISTMWFTLMAIFMFSFVVPFIGNCTGVRVAITVPMTWPVFYLIAGHIWFHESPRIPWWAYLVGFVAGLAFIISTKGGQLINVICAKDSVVMAICAVCLFGLFRRIDRKADAKNGQMKQLGSSDIRLWSIDRLCFGVYLVHPLFIHVAYRMLGFRPSGSMLLLKTVGIALMVTVMAFCTSWVLNKIPVLRKYVL